LKKEEQKCFLRYKIFSWRAHGLIAGKPSGTFLLCDGAPVFLYLSTTGKWANKWEVND
jgi:hypothetical protein